MQISDIISYFETRYPHTIRDLQYDEKNTGLIVGAEQEQLYGVVVSLECSLETIEYAKKQNANLIICHHTPFFQPIQTYNASDYRVKVLKKLLAYNIAVYCSHTALDRAKAEHNISGLLAKTFELQQVSPFLEDEGGYGYGVTAAVTTDQRDFLNHIQAKTSYIQTNNVVTKLKKVAIVGGAGANFWQVAQSKGCDALLTGDVTYHTAQDAQRESFLLIDIGHEAEELAMQHVARWLAEYYRVDFFQQKERILQ